MSEESTPGISFSTAKQTQQGEEAGLSRTLHPSSCFNTWLEIISVCKTLN